MAPKPPGPPTIAGAINAEDLEASLLGPPTGHQGPPSGHQGPLMGPNGPQAGPIGPLGPLGPLPDHQGPPPGFGAIQLGHILSQLGPPVRPQGPPNVEQLQMMQRHLQSLGLPPTGLIGGLLPGQEPHLAPLPGGPHGHPSGDPLGIQSLASLGPHGSGPMMMPMMPFGGPPMGLLPFAAHEQAGHFFGQSPPVRPPQASPAPGSPRPPASPPHASWPPVQPPMFGGLTGPVPPFSSSSTGFPTSVLFPADPRHPHHPAQQHLQLQLRGLGDPGHHPRHDGKEKTSKHGCTSKLYSNYMF